MSFKRVIYKKVVKEKPLSPMQKEQLKKQINAVIDAATRSIAIEAIVQSSKDDQKKKLKKRR